MQVKFRQASLSVVVAAALLAASGVGANSKDPLHGTWKLNVAKSKYSPGPAPKAAIVKYEAAGDALKVTVDLETDKGNRHWEYTTSFDGKDYPVTGNPDSDAASVKRIDAATTETTFKKGGKTTTINKRVVSADGKTLTITIKGTNAEGQAVNNVQVFDKQ
jgi:hypothetical protein